LHLTEEFRRGNAKGVGYKKTCQIIDVVRFTFEYYDELERVNAILRFGKSGGKIFRILSSDSNAPTAKLTAPPIAISSSRRIPAPFCCGKRMQNSTTANKVNAARPAINPIRPIRLRDQFLAQAR
jgi:hypothetical protein